MLTAKIKQKLKGTAKVEKPKPIQTSSPKPRKPVSSTSMPTKPVVLNKRQAKKETVVVQPAPQPVKPQPERKMTAMPIPQPPTSAPAPMLPPPPPIALAPIALAPIVIPPATPLPPAMKVELLEEVSTKKSAHDVLHKPIEVEPVMPKVDAEPVVLSSYFSVQLLRGESYRDVSNAVLTAADSLGVLFRKLQVMDIMAVGTTAFVRFRSDILELDKVLQVLATAERKRGYVAADQTGAYVVNFQDGRRGKYPTSTMNSSHKLGFGQTFAGTRIKKWRQQF